MAVPCYKLYRGSTALYFGTISLRKHNEKSLDTIEIPYTTTRYLMDEVLTISRLQIQARVDLGKHYSTDALFETAVSNILSQTGGVYLDAGTVEVDGASFSSDSAQPFRVTSGALLIKNIEYEKNSNNPYSYDLRINLEIGESVFGG